MIKPLPIILDCDPGIDDALALTILAKYKDNFDIRLITTCAGNTPIAITTKNIQFFASKFFDGVRIAKGIGHAMKKINPENAEDVHGMGGLGNFSIPEQTYPYDQNAIETMRAVIMHSNEPITIVALGPLSNIGTLIQTYPEVCPKIAEIHTMIGSIKGIGNIKEYAEFNAYFDPDALDIVTKSGIRMIFNTMETGQLTSTLKTDFTSHPASGEIADMIKQIVDGIYEFRDPSKITLFDTNTIMALVYPELYNFTPCNVEVHTEEELSGQTIMTENEQGRHAYILPKPECNVTQRIIDEIFSFNN